MSAGTRRKLRLRDGKRNDQTRDRPRKQGARARSEPSEGGGPGGRGKVAGARAPSRPQAHLPLRSPLGLLPLRFPLSPESPPWPPSASRVPARWAPGRRRGGPERRRPCVPRCRAAGRACRRWRPWARSTSRVDRRGARRERSSGRAPCSPELLPRSAPRSPELPRAPSDPSPPRTPASSPLPSPSLAAGDSPGGKRARRGAPGPLPRSLVGRQRSLGTGSRRSSPLHIPAG